MGDYAISDKLYTALLDYDALRHCEPQARQACSEYLQHHWAADIGALRPDDKQKFVETIGSQGLGLLAMNLPHDSDESVARLSDLLFLPEPHALWPAYRRANELQTGRAGAHQAGDEGMQAVVASMQLQADSPAKAAMDLALALQSGTAPPPETARELNAQILSQAHAMARESAKGPLHFVWLGRHLRCDSDVLSFIASKLDPQDVAALAAVLHPADVDKLARKLDAWGKEGSLAALWGVKLQQQPEAAVEDLMAAKFRSPDNVVALVRAAEQWPAAAREAVWMKYGLMSLSSSWSDSQVNPASFAQWIEQRAQACPDDVKKLFKQLADSTELRADSLAMLRLALNPGAAAQLDAVLRAESGDEAVAQVHESAARNRVEIVRIGGSLVQATRAATEWGLISLADNPSGEGVKILGVRGPAARMKLQAGDTLVSINGEAATSALFVRDHLFDNNSSGNPLQVEYTTLSRPGVIRVTLPPRE